MIGLALPTTWMNERTYVVFHALYKAGADNVKKVDPNEDNTDKNWALVHMSGPLEADEAVGDDTLGVKVEAVAIRRKVEVYQYHEEKRKGNDNQPDVYDYNLTWQTSVNSGDGWNQEAAGNAGVLGRNPRDWPLEGERTNNQTTHLGKYYLADS